MPENNENSWSAWSQSGGWKGRKQWMKEFVEKKCFEPRVEERRMVIKVVFVSQ